MKITVVLITYNNGQEFIDCLDAILGQRILKPDLIKIYDLGSTDTTISYANDCSVDVIDVSKIFSRKSNKFDIFKYIVNDNLDTDILIHLAPHVIIDRSAISEIFRLFLKYEDLGLVYGRQNPLQDSLSLNRFYYRYLFPITRRDIPVWHIHKVFCSMNMIAFNVKHLLNKQLFPKTNQYNCNEIYLSAKLIQSGLRIMYNPFAFCLNPHEITRKKLVQKVKNFYLFLHTNEWITERWNIRKSEIDILCSDMKTYIKDYSLTHVSFFYTFFIYISLLYAKNSALKEYKKIKNQQIKNAKKAEKELYYNK